MDEKDEFEYDLRQEEDNRAYMSSKCTKPHKDGSECMPEWDGFGYVCVTNILEEKE